MNELANRAWACLWDARASFCQAHREVPPDVRLRALGELAYVLLLAIDNGLGERADVVALTAFASSAIEEINWAVLARRDPRFYVAVLTWQALAAALGEPRAAYWQRLARRAAHTGALRAITAAPHRRLELWYLLDRAGLRLDETPVRKIYRETIAGRRYALSRCTPADQYALTHTVFYVSDHGRMPMPRFLGREELVYLKTTVQRAIFLALAEHRLDLLGELVIAAACLRISVDAVTTRIESTLHAALDADGWVRTHEDVASASPFRAHYHATLVWALAASLGARPPR